MRVAIVLFEDVTVLDAVGPFQMLDGLPGVEAVFVAERPGPVRGHGGRVALVADAALDEVGSPEVVCVPGGPGQTRLMDGGPVVDWVRGVEGSATWVTSVCTGSLVLAAAGVLAGRRATTHWLAMEELGRWGAVPTSERVVFDGKYVTAAGVSSGIDMGLALAERLTDRRTAELVQLVTEYDPAPPFDAGSPGRAPAEVVAMARSMSRFILTGE
ncbi:DJ-1/PfpI family protein [Nocardiopsis sp. NPDC049922]|uniref:DJ-1/PfpI family protein n=1 Tax=Nocardiopsis sp. NPDC049922 TaxID=3155157 RepID=UPI0033CE4344